jgi:hypothetical protein
VSRRRELFDTCFLFISHSVFPLTSASHSRPPRYTLLAANDQQRMSLFRKWRSILQPIDPTNFPPPGIIAPQHAFALSAFLLKPISSSFRRWHQEAFRSRAVHHERRDALHPAVSAQTPRLQRRRHALAASQSTRRLSGAASLASSSAPRRLHLEPTTSKQALQF